jgi:CRISPR system Cascade subunit CasE
MNMIASVLNLDRLSIKALSITDPYSLHRVVYSLFEDTRTHEQKERSISSGILFADQGGYFYSRTILLLSDRTPAERVDGQYGEVFSKPVSESFLNHDTYRFKTIVNPTRRDSASKKLIAVKGRNSIHAWFNERAHTSWGFSVDVQNLQVDNVEVLQFKDKERRQVTISQAYVQGVLSVTNREQFISSFKHGIGRAKSFGCGLLQIVPIVNQA